MKKKNWMTAREIDGFEFLFLLHSIFFSLPETLRDEKQVVDIKSFPSGTISL